MMRLRPDIRFFSSKDRAMMTSFRVKPQSEQQEMTYAIPPHFPRADTPIGTLRRIIARVPKVRMSRQEMDHTLSKFLEDTKHIGLDVGQKDPAVRLLRVTGVGIGESRQNPELHPGSSRIKINDENGNDVTFRMTYEIGTKDARNRVWDRVVIRVEKAHLDGHRVHITPEMKRDGFVFLTYKMPEILREARGEEPNKRNGRKKRKNQATVRQETPDATCFNDGHHASAGREDLGCRCREERQKSLQIIHKRGGISCLMPGVGNGNGSEAQDMQVLVRNSSARRGGRTISYHDFYPRIGKQEDARNEELRISTLIMEHLFQMKDVPNITTLTHSTTKQNVWNTFGSKHVVTGEPLSVTRENGVDFQSKVETRGYRRTGQLTQF